MNDENRGTVRFELDTERFWELVAKQVDRFVHAWDAAGPPPELMAFLPDEASPVRRTVLTELVKTDMEMRWTRQHDSRRIEFYLDAFPELLVAGMAPSDLIYEEFHTRRQAGEEVDAAEYVQRFPSQAAELQRLLDAEQPLFSTALHHSRTMDSIEVGQVIDDFDLLTKLGQGAFALVFLARQRTMQRLVALKVTSDHSQEPETLARLDHPHIVRVYDQRQLADRGLRLLYMQFVSGGTLQDVIRSMQNRAPNDWHGRALVDIVDQTLESRGVEPPPGTDQRRRLAEMDWPSAVCLIGSQLAEALAYAHQQGVLHRDLKPANILLTEAVIPKLVDFNVSSCSKLDGASPAAYFGGSLAYMSPEQLEASNPQHARDPNSLDGRSDVYALGVVLWELLTGNRPFQDVPLSEGWPATVAAMTQRRQIGFTDAHWRQFSRSCPSALQAILGKCLSPPPDERYRDAESLAAQLRRCLNPAAQRMLALPQTGWRRIATRWPTWVMVVLLLTPNILAGAFNYNYNWRTIIEPNPEAQPIFQAVQFVINAAAFPLGALVGIRMVWPVAVEVRRRNRVPTKNPAQQWLRHRCLTLGHRLSMLGLCLWLIAGVAYPVCLKLGGAALGGVDYAHFFGSLTICGLIAAAFPFFGAFWVVVESWYPLFVAEGKVDQKDLPLFKWLQRISWRYLVIAVFVPMLSVAFLVVWNDPNTRLSLQILSVGGTLMFATVFALARRVQNDLTILRAECKAEVQLPSD